MARDLHNDLQDNAVTRRLTTDKQFFEQSIGTLSPLALVLFYGERRYSLTSARYTLAHVLNHISFFISGALTRWIGAPLAFLCVLLYFPSSFFNLHFENYDE
ncbi:MAG: hypothetical protein MKZ98_06695 [Pseudomonadales bacterium]|nr:hypothetical protein [Pseudomonadales bacterium]